MTYAVETELGTFETDREDIAERIADALGKPAARETDLVTVVFAPWRDC